MRIRRAVLAAVALDVLVGGAWAFTTVLTSAGPPPFPHLTLSLVSDCGQLAGTVTGDTVALLAALAAVNATCLLAARLRARRKAHREAEWTGEPVIVFIDESDNSAENPAVRAALSKIAAAGRRQ